MNWHLQDAKNHFSKLVKQVRSEGPQTVTVRGERAAVVLSAEDYDRLVSGRKRTIVDHILSGPDWDDDFVEEINRRPKSSSRSPRRSHLFGAASPCAGRTTAPTD